MAACASVLVDAYKHVREFPSTAEDSGEAERTAKHFAQYAINHAHMELTATQAAGVVLGHASSGGSGARLDYHSAWDFVKLARVAHMGDVAFEHVRPEEDEKEQEEEGDARAEEEARERDELARAFDFDEGV